MFTVERNKLTATDVSGNHNNGERGDNKKHSTKSTPDPGVKQVNKIQVENPASEVLIPGLWTGGDPVNNPPRSQPG